MEIIKNSIKNLDIKEDEVILDIETTGLSAKYSAIYMIGLIYKEEKKLKFEQLFALKKEDEYEILFTLFKIIKDKKIISYNGDSFDMRFIKERADIYGLDCPKYTSIDLIKPARKLKTLLGLTDVKLKTIENYFGYDREDEFTGGMLIELYYAFLENFDDKLKQVILLHNYEDVLNLEALIDNSELRETIESRIINSYFIKDVVLSNKHARVILKNQTEEIKIDVPTIKHKNITLLLDERFDSEPKINKKKYIIAVDNEIIYSNIYFIIRVGGGTQI